MKTKPHSCRAVVTALASLLPIALALGTFAPRAAGQASAPAATSTSGSADDVVRLTEFEVSTTRDQGYRPGNSVSATRIDTPIKDLPFSISAFTPQFIADTNARDLLDVVRYAAGVTNGAREFNAGNAVYSVRGFPQPPEHDGFYESAQGNVYVDTVNIERVEVVKGPASLLYGQIAPGGTVNYITKQADPKAFSVAHAEVGSYKYLRGTLDVNEPILPRTLLFRINGAWENGVEYAEPSRTRTWVVAPTATWNIGPRVRVRVNYQWFKRRENPPAVYYPNVEVSTPASIVAAFDPTRGYPGPASALTGRTGPDAEAGFGSDASDPGFLPYYPALPRRFNYSGNNDWRKANLETLNAELDVTLSDQWLARGNFNYNFNRDSQQLTGVGNIYLAPPNTLNFSNGTWSVAPSWTALSSAQQIAAELAFAQQINADRNAVFQLQNGTSAPAVMARRPRLQEQWGNNRTAQVEAAGKYAFSWGTVKPVFGLFYDAVYGYSRLRQNTGTASSPYFHSWDVNPGSPTYYIDLTTAFAPTTLTQLNTHTLSFSSDQAAYGILNLGLLDNRLYVVGGARYSRSQSQTTNFLAAAGTNPVGQGYRTTYTTPQVGAGYKITPDLMVYASYSESASLPGQTSIRTIQTVNGVLQSVPTSQAVPVRGVGYEVGVKTDFLNGRVSSTLSVYQIEQKNVLQTVNQIIGGIVLATDFQGTKVRGRGIEAEVTWSPTDNWQVFASVSEEDIRNTAEPAGYLYYLGAHPQMTAKTLANLWTRYSFTNGAVKGLWVGGGFNYVGRMSGDNRNKDFFLPAYTLWNAVVGYDWTYDRYKMTATLNWQNIANEIYQPANQVRGLPQRVVGTFTVRF